MANKGTQIAGLVTQLAAARAAYIKAGGRWGKGETPALAALGTALIQARAALRAAAGTPTVRAAYAKLGVKPVYRTRVKA